MEAQLRAVAPGNSKSNNLSSSEATPAIQTSAPTAMSVVRAKKKGSQSLSVTWYDGLAEPHVFVSQSVTKAALYEFRHMGGYMMLFLLDGFQLDAKSPAFKAEVLALGEQAQANSIDFVKASESSAVVCGTVVKFLRQLQKNGKLDTHIARFHERADSGDIIDPTPKAAHASFI